MSVTVSIAGGTAVNVSVSGNTGVSVLASGGIGPAGFITVPGTATNAFGTFQLTPGPGITVSTTSGTFTIASYDTAAVASYAPVQSVAGRTGAVTLSASDVTAGTFAIARIPTISYTNLASVPTTFEPSAHTHDASAISAGTLAHARLPTISYTALSNVPASFTPSSHTHSTTDVVSFTSAAAAAAPVQSVQSRTGAVVLTRADLTAAAEIHTHSTADVVGLTAAFSQVGHTHDAADVASGVLAIGRIPTIGYTALSGVPLTFAPATHTHSTSDITGYQGLPAQAGYAGPLVTDGTNATWTSRYGVVSPVLVQGDGMVLTRDTAAGSITVAFAGGTSGVAVGSATPQPLGVAAAGSSANASREDHVHALPTLVESVSGLTGTLTIAAGSNVTVSTAGSTITIAAGGGGGSAAPASRALSFVFRT